MASVLKYFFLFFFGGIVYVLIEMLWRGYSQLEYVYIGANMLCTFRTYKQKIHLGYSFVNTNADRHFYHNINGIYLRVYF